ncbi:MULTISPECIES: type II TA system antitoxin MqsA family protein [Lactobacillus]|uniref:Helix-turn-helix domain-containing protein n=1 Tax=Lactobacillus xujianguonis TaxID=2495899 RepID=A0A437SXJ4_9LACO|nr:MULTISPECIES: type II TA system antitoxin MqsA family protein [Lactobacillus]RVU71590.1 helix-turn-helix domain-containing protein [Lactobacillus xujianguonis]
MTTTSIKNYTNTFNIRGTEIEITAPARINNATGEVVPDMELDNTAIKMAQDKYRKKFNFVGPEDIKKLRQKWQLSQKEFAKVIGWSPSTVALYEVGEIPTKSNNRLLKVMIKDPKVMEAFIAESKADDNLKEL